MTLPPRPPWLGRLLLRLARLGVRREERAADLGELFELRSVARGQWHARFRYVADAASILLRSWRSGNSPRPRLHRSSAWAFSVVQDIRFGFRLFRRQTGVMLLSIVGLALAIGINTSVFTLVNAAVRPLGVAQPDRAVRIAQGLRATRAGFSARTDWAYGDYLQLRELVRQITLEAWVAESGSLSVPSGGPQDVPVRIAFVSGGFFSTFGGRTLVGRQIVPSDDSPSAPPVVVLSELLWRTQFASDPSVVGRRVTISGSAATIVGVAVREFTGLQDPFVPPIWMALRSSPQISTDLGPYTASSTEDVSVVGSLSPSSSLASAEAEASAAAVQLMPVGGHDSALAPQGARVSPAAVTWTTDRVVQVVASMAIFMSVLVLACTNIANLLLASAARRQAEIASRLALGATRGRIIRQLLTESVLMASAAGTLGVLTAVWTLPLLSHMILVPVGVDLSPDWHVFAFGASSSLLAGVLSGLAAARHGARGDLVSPLKGIVQGAFDSRPGRARSVFLSVQAGICATLLIVGSLLARTLLRELDSNFGFDPAHFASVDFYLAKNRDGSRLEEIYPVAVDRLRSFPGVRDVSLVTYAPFSRTYLPVTLQHDGQHLEVMEHRTSANFFESMGLRLVRGRTFTDDDVRLQAPAAVISARTAAALWGSVDPVGQLLEPAGGAPKYPGAIDLSKVRVIGVVSDVVFRASDPDKSDLYLPLEPADLNGQPVLWVRTTGDSAAMTKAMRDAVVALNPDLRVSVTPSSQALELQLDPAKASATMVGILGGLGLALSVIGVFGVTTLLVGQRLSELSVRMTLGATSRDLIRLIVGDTLRPVAIGLVPGVGAALVLGRWFESRLLLGGVSAHDPLSIAAALVLLAATATIAALLPARRATQVDPARVLRQA